MRKKIVSGISLLLTMMLGLTGLAVAEVSTLDVEGTVVNANPVPVLAAQAGTLMEVPAVAGASVTAGDPVASLKTTKVVAPVSGTVRVVGQVGDDTAQLLETYGGAAFVEPDVVYTISASTRYAYDEEENKVIHPGETVYLRAANTASHVGVGRVTMISGTTFTVEVLEGNFEQSETVRVYRSSEYTDRSRIGRGSTARAAFSAVEGTGVIVRYAVADGDHVNKGDVLFETVEGTFAGYGAVPGQFTATVNGIISSVAVSAGTAVAVDDTLCTIYPHDSLRVEAALDQEELALVSVGDTVQVTFEVGSEEVIRQGTVERLSAVSSAEEGTNAAYTATIRLEDATGLRYGMECTVTK